MTDKVDKVTAVQVSVTTFPRVFFTPAIADDIRDIISTCIFNRMHRYHLIPPRFISNPTLDNGVLTIKCKDQCSVEVLSEYFAMKQEAYYNRFRHEDFPELHIKFHADYETPELVKCSISIPTHSDTVWVVHQKLSTQNKEYDIDNWYYITHEKMENPDLLILKYYVPKEIIDEIKKYDFKLSLGFGCIILNLDPN